MDINQLNQEMGSNLKQKPSMFPPDSPEAIDLRIKSVQAEIAILESTVARLAADGHEVADATAHLRALFVTLTALVNAKTSLR